jgi:hypothetical protein
LFKRILFGGAAAGALTTAYLVGSISLGGVFAQTTPAPSPSTTAAQPATPTAKESAEQADTANEPSETAALASQAKVSADQAKTAALAKFPGATVGKIEFDNENGVIAYSVELVDSAGTGQDVKVDATSGALLSAQVEGDKHRPLSAVSRHWDAHSSCATPGACPT